MHIRALFRYSVCILFLSAFLSTGSLAADSGPNLNDGKKWRIGYYEGGPYSDYTDTMRTLIEGLIELEWINDHNPPGLNGEMAKPYWDWLSKINGPFKKSYFQRAGLVA